jgi:hypothetical protein
LEHSDEPIHIAPAFHPLAFCGLGGPSRHVPNRGSEAGTIALSDWPYCVFAVIDAGHGFALIQRSSRMWIFDEVDPVLGRVDRTGVQTVHLDGLITAGDMIVIVEEVGVDLRFAQKAFYRRCKIQ